MDPDRVAEELNALDATFLELEEGDQSAHMHIGGVMLFEPTDAGGAPPIELVREDVEARLDHLPRFRQQLSDPHTGGLSWPRWVENDRFDIAHHVTRAGLAEPGGEEELRDWASEYFSQRLDRARPLWELVVVALADGRWALVTKTHHCMVDGVGSVDIAQTLLDADRDAPRPAHQDAPAAPAPEPVEEDGSRRGSSSPAAPAQLIFGAAGAAMQLVGSGLHAAGGILKTGAAGLDAVAHPSRVRDALHRSRALADVLVRDEIVSAPATSLNDPIGAKRSLAVVEVDLERLKAIKRSLGGTVNDVVLAAATGGLRRLLEGRDERLPPQGLRAMVPVNIRSAGDHLALGNKVTSLFVHLPVAEADTLDRYRRQTEEAETLKAGTQAEGSRTLINLTAHAPPILHSFVARSLFATRLFNVTITNVPGPPVPLHAFGSRMLAVWPLVPIAAEHAVGLAVFSYDGTLFFCLNVDRDSMPDLEVLRGGIATEIDQLEVLAAEAASAGNGQR